MIIFFVRRLNAQDDQTNWARVVYVSKSNPKRDSAELLANALRFIKARHIETETLPKRPSANRSASHSAARYPTGKRLNQPTTWLASVNALRAGEQHEACWLKGPTGAFPSSSLFGYIAFALELADCPRFPGAFSDPAGILHFGHRHVFRTHHHRNATGECVGRNLVYGVSPCGASFRANNVVLSLNDQLSDWSQNTCEWVIRAHHRHRNLVKTPRVGQTDERGFVHAPPLEMRQFKSRGQFYEPLGGESRLASKGWGCAIIGRARWQAPGIRCCGFSLEIPSALANHY